MDSILLRDPEVFPSEEVLSSALAGAYPAWEALSDMITGISNGLQPEWRYYNDGKAWLCKVVHKKKTVFWVSVWEGYFTTALYISERHCPGIYDLEIDESIKNDLRSAKPSGKLFPVVLKMRTADQVTDLLKLIEYKKSLR
jgi:hypothetical protein